MPKRKKRIVEPTPKEETPSDLKLTTSEKQSETVEVLEAQIEEPAEKQEVTVAEQVYTGPPLYTVKSGTYKATLEKPALPKALYLLCQRLPVDGEIRIKRIH